MKRVGNTELVEFTPRKEPWGQYQLEDGTVLRLRTTITSVHLVRRGPSVQVSFGSTNQIVVWSPESIRGKPSKQKYSVDDLRKGKLTSMMFKTEAPASAEYELRGGTIVRLETSVVQVNRAHGRFDKQGNRVYLVDWATNVILSNPQGLNALASRARSRLSARKGK